MRGLYRPRWPLLFTLVIGVGALVALAYVPSRESGDALPARGGVYVEGVAGSPSTINPLFASFNDVDRDLSSLIFSGLVRLGPNGAVQPDLAELPTITPDGLTYAFELKRGLFWHDGTPLTAEDVVFTIDVIQHPDFRGDPVLADLFREAQAFAPDDHTVIIALPEAFAPFLARGATVGVLPAHLLRDVPVSELEAASFNERPVGSGPFRLTQLSGASALLRPFDAYHFERPFLRRLELRFYRDDGELLSALRNGEIDGALFRPGLDREAIEFVDADGRWVRRSLHGTAMTLVYLDAGVEAFESERVRQALQHGVDIEALTANVLQGQGIALDSPIVPDLWAHVGSPDAFAYDPQRAAALLDAEGWELSGGVRMRDSETLSFSLAASDDPVQVEVAQELARQWKELGVEVEVQVSGASQFVEGVLLPREFEAALVTIDPGPDPDPYPFWHSTQALGEGRNLAGFADAEADELLENGRLTSSSAQRAEDYRAFQEIFARELPALLLYTPTYQYVTDAALQGLSPGLLHTLSARFDDVHKWFMGRETGAEDGGDEDA